MVKLSCTHGLFSLGRLFCAGVSLLCEQQKIQALFRSSAFTCTDFELMQCQFGSHSLGLILPWLNGAGLLLRTETVSKTV